MSEEDHKTEGGTEGGLDAAKEERIRMMAKVVCICKGITLGRVMKGIEGCETVADVNRKVGTGSGGCAGERCGPRIALILKKLREAKEKKS
jgi:NAD(P)H-nitrite reductase large subunit